MEILRCNTEPLSGTSKRKQTGRKFMWGKKKAGLRGEEMVIYFETFKPPMLQMRNC